jgi:hypothetical protein
MSPIRFQGFVVSFLGVSLYTTPLSFTPNLIFGVLFSSDFSHFEDFQSKTAARSPSSRINAGPGEAITGGATKSHLAHSNRLTTSVYEPVSWSDKPITLSSEMTSRQLIS